MGGNINWVPVGADKGYDLNEIEKESLLKQNLYFFVILIILLEHLFLQAISVIQHKKTIVFPDEAYYDYIEKPNYPSMIMLLKKVTT